MTRTILLSAWTFDVYMLLCHPLSRYHLHHKLWKLSKRNKIYDRAYSNTRNINEKSHCDKIFFVVTDVLSLRHLYDINIENISSQDSFQISKRTL